MWSLNEKKNSNFLIKNKNKNNVIVAQILHYDILRSPQLLAWWDYSRFDQAIKFVDEIGNSHNFMAS